MSVQPSDLLQYLAEFKVIVCTSCQYALQPSAISRHLKDIHHILRSSRKPFVQYVLTFDLDNPDTVIRSTDDLKEFPVALLPVYDGLKCSYQDCSHLCVTEKRMKRHWVVEHDRPGRPKLDWSSVPLQTFFRGNSLHYFTKLTLSPMLNRQIPNKAPIGDLEATLLQHYIASTSLTLADGIELPYYGLTILTPPGSVTDLNASTSLVSGPSPKLRGALISIWQEVIPQLAETSTFLMHGILACAAFHLAYLSPSKRQSHFIIAATYQELAMPLFREALANLDAKNCHSIFAFVHILAICSFTSENENERLLLVDQDSPDLISNWLFFLRSGCDYVETVRDSVEHGPLTALLCEWVKPMDVYDGPRTPLVKRLLSFIPSQDCEDAWLEKDCETYRDAVHKLGYAFICAERLGKYFNTWDALRVWPVLLSVDYLQQLQDLHPGALIVLAHYCFLLHKLEGKWYFEGRAKRLSRHILQRLDSKWHPHVKWPVE